MFNVYGILCKTTWKVYYGSTEKNIEQRLEIHKKDYKKYLKGKSHYCSSFEIIKNDNYEIELLEECDNILNMRLREDYYIITFPCVNMIRASIPERTRKEYYQDNKEKMKEYREEHKEENREYQKKYHETFKEEISEKKKEKYTCACGSTLRKDCKARHEKTNKHKKYLETL